MGAVVPQIGIDGSIGFCLDVEGLAGKIVDCFRG